MVAVHRMGILQNISFTLKFASDFCFEGKSLRVGGNKYLDSFGNALETEEKETFFESK